MTQSIRATALAFVVALSVSAPAAAETMTCDSIIANAERSKLDMEVAAATYFHGKFMGKPCVKVDYARAFALAKKGGVSIEPWLRILRQRAETGNPAAISALAKFGP